MKTIPQLGLKLAATVSGSALIALGAMAIPVTSAVADDPITINNGTITWGFKASWRNYIPKDGVVPTGGVTINEAGEYVWPITTGTYNPETKSLELTLGGSLQFLNHCTETGNIDSCILNSTLSNLTLYLNESDSHIQGDYAGVPMSDWDAGVLTGTDVRLASLSTETATYAYADGTSTYSDISVSAGSGLQLYAEGIELDPLSITYTGSGGLPAIDTIVNQGVPRFAAAGDWDSGSASWMGGWRLYPASSTNTVLQIDNQAGKTGEGVQATTTTVRAIDADTMTQVAAQSFDNIVETTSVIPFSSTAFSASTDTVYVLQPYNTAAENRLNTGRSGTAIKAFTWTGSTLEASDFYTTDEVLSGSNPRIYVLPERNALVLYWQKSGENPQLRLIDLSTKAVTNVTVTSSTCVSEEEDWSDELNDIITVEVPFADTFSRESNNDEVVAETPTGFVRFYANTLSINPTSTLAEFTLSDGENGTINAAISCSATLKDAEGTDATIAPYQWLAERADGTYFAYGAKGKFAILSKGEAGWSTVKTNSLSQFEVQGNEYYVADDANGLAYIYSENQDQIWTLNNDGEIIDTVNVADASTRVSLLTGMVMTKDGSLVYNATANGTEVLRKLAADGTTPVVTKDPEAITVEVGSGIGATGTAYFCATATGTHGDLTSYWQVKSPEGKSFLRTSVEGDLATFTVSADQNGYEYRIVYKDSSGAVASRAATLTVVTTDNPKPTTSSCLPAEEPVDDVVPADDDAADTQATSDNAPDDQAKVVAVAKPKALPKTGTDAGGLFAGIVSLAVVGLGIRVLRTKHSA